MTTNYPIHILIRFSDTLFSMGDVILLHQDLINEHGYVWFGKIGTPIAQSRIDLINAQIQNQIPSYVFLVKGNRRKSTFYKAKITKLTPIFPKEEKELIPKYYFEKDIVSNMRFWVKISAISFVEPIEINNYKVIGSAFDINESLGRSSSGHFFIKKTSK